MKGLIIGKSGQLATELHNILPEFEKWGTVEVGNIDSGLVKRVVDYNADVIINAAAYTAVDAAEESEQEAYKVNLELPSLLVEACSRNHTKLVHVSTDYVFSGEASTPYLPSSAVSPLGVYGKSKALAETAVMRSSQNCVIRTSWVYSTVGNNFLKTMIKLMQTRDSISVVCDQIGSPTWAGGLARACSHAAFNSVKGIHHWSDYGVASWYDFAIAIQEIGLRLGLFSTHCQVIPIRSEDFPTKSPRPNFSVLDKESLKRDFADILPNHWRKQLEIVMESMV
ncbi:dTDP-4-dehydrorhamnose reductase [Alteromonas sp. ASW11-36]|uniref:dTDP-4-dehydrorhamnose reductase n=1 Tax=Alteromonas arenosi TaxID=3055817 RepID=A0ABT7T0M2_9ALTE|nr:dTDP-4-dehydrorhamnose reductase [Alteromonas sp. ASW11-36]MDM7861982.1 dTDP-4-dehydrorhamnose reductase [Alteromonas sp. ASW11-36]